MEEKNITKNENKKITNDNFVDIGNGKKITKQFIERMNMTQIKFIKENKNRR